MNFRCRYLLFTFINSIEKTINCTHHSQSWIIESSFSINITFQKTWLAPTIIQMNIGSNEIRGDYSKANISS